MTEFKKEKIQGILNVFETGSIKGDYSNISIFADGPNRRRQITYGKSQTTEWGNLNKLISKYIDLGGTYSRELNNYEDVIGQRSLVDDKYFIKLLKDAAKNDPIMIKAQDQFFDTCYWKPAYKWAINNGFKENLSMLVCYDSFIHSGSILGFLRRRFPASPKDERLWIEQYLNTRHNWLKGHSNKILRKTIYRTRDMIRTLEAGDWNLDEPFNANGVIVK